MKPCDGTDNQSDLIWTIVMGKRIIEMGQQRIVMGAGVSVVGQCNFIMGKWSCVMGQALS